MHTHTDTIRHAHVETCQKLLCWVIEREREREGERERETDEMGAPRAKKVPHGTQGWCEDDLELKHGWFIRESVVLFWMIIFDD